MEPQLGPVLESELEPESESELEPELGWVLVEGSG